MLGRFSLAKGMLASVAVFQKTKADEILAVEEPRQLNELTQGARELYFCDPNFEDCEMGPEWQGFNPEIGFGDFEEYGDWEDAYGDWEDNYDDYNEGPGYYEDLSLAPVEEPINSWFYGFDKNEDGTIDSNELNTVFSNVDTDENGFLSRAELLKGQLKITASSLLCSNYFFQNYFSERMWDPTFQYFGQPTFGEMSFWQEMEWLAENYDDSNSYNFRQIWQGLEERRRLQDAPESPIQNLDDWPLFDRFDIDQDNQISQEEWLNVMMSYSQFYDQFTNEWEPLLIREREACMAESNQLSFERSKRAEDCSITCALTEGCFFFHFDPNDGECVSVDTSSPECPEGFQSSPYYDFYQNYNSQCGDDCSSTPPPVPRNDGMPEGIYLIREDSSCDSRNFPLGYFTSLSECGTACLDHPTCQFFLYDSNDGECAQEETESIECPEGLSSSNYYNFYAVEREDTPVTVDASEVTLLAERQQCASDDAQIGYADDLRDCSDMCIEQFDCMFFLFDPNDGECRVEYTQGTPACPEGLEVSEWYDFYQNRARTSEEQARADAEGQIADEEEEIFEELTGDINFTLLYERQECSSENEQFGFYLEEGVDGCAIACSQTPGCNFFIFDPNDGECLWEKTTSASCPEGLVDSPYYDMYDLIGAQEEQSSEGIALLGESVQCSSEDEPLGYFDSLEECAQECRITSGCNFILYDSNDGECRNERATSADCPEGLFSSSYYNFYEVFSDSTGNSVILIGRWQSCVADDFGLGYFTEGIDACADQCRATPGCRFVSFDANDGECLQELTSSADCPEGLSSSVYYSFYEVLSGDSQPQDDITLLQEWAQCDSSNTGLGYFDDLSRCAAECLDTENCQFFIYDSNDGECLMENTSTPQCPEGLSDSIYYNFYQVYNPDIFVPIDVDKEYTYEVIRTLTRCSAEFGESTYVPIEECAEKCFDDKECSFFHHDANDGECFVSYAQSRSCPSGFEESPYYTFYQLFADDRAGGNVDDGGQSEGRGDYVTILINEWTACGSENFTLGYEDSMAGCAEACNRTEDCFFFIYDSNDGECIQERTSSAECTEGTWSSNYYHFYSNVYGTTTGPPVDTPSGLDFSLIAERQACEADSNQLGYTSEDPEECAELCINEPSCAFFHHDPNDGECVQVYTQYQECPEGLNPSQWYDFYTVSRDGAPVEPVDPVELRDVPETWETNEWTATLKEANAYCSENTRTLGVNLDSLQECAQLCYELASCNYFLWSAYGQCDQDYADNEFGECEFTESFKNFYELERTDRSGEVLGGNDDFAIVLVQENAQCLSREVDLGEYASLEGCGAACWEYFDCTIFIYDSQDGECFQELTDSANCPEDVRFSNWFDMYEVKSQDGTDRDTSAPDREPEAPMPYTTEQLATYSECSTENVALGYDFDFQRCAQLCFESGDCEFFLHDPNDGECLKESTYNRSCTPGDLIESQYYMLYWNRPNNARRLQEFVETNVVMISEGDVCLSDTIELGFFMDSDDQQENLRVCAQAVIDEGYQFFIQDPSDGDCQVSTTFGGDCPEGLIQSEYYDFYAAYGWGNSTETESEPEREIEEPREPEREIEEPREPEREIEEPREPEREIEEPREPEAEATLRLDDIYAFLTENAADVCQDPRQHDFLNATDPPIDDKNLKLAFTHIWFFFDTDRNGEINPFDIRMKFFELQGQSSTGKLDKATFDSKLKKNLVEMCFESAIIYDGDDSCEFDKNQSIYRANRCSNNQKGDLFALFDDNEDGVLSGTEFSGPLRNGDFDGDFLLSPEEFLYMLKENQEIICKDYEETIDEVISEMAKLGLSTIVEYNERLEN